MMKLKWFAVAAALLAGIASACAHEGHHHQHAAASTPSKKEAIMYTCPMHPEVRQEKPGNCPKCGMKLEPA